MKYSKDLIRLSGYGVIFLFAVLAGGCATTGINSGQVNLISSPEEVQMGKEFSVEIEKQFEIYDDPEVSGYVQRVGNRLVQVCDRRDIEYHFAVINKDELNAFALPGGYIYIYTGLLSELDDEAQLAGVLAHEIGHVASRHSTERLTAMYGYQILSSLILGDNPGQMAQLVSNIFSTGGFLAYSRTNEFEADRLGSKYSNSAGYDPNGIVELLGKLHSTEEREPGKLEELLSTHPPTSDRIARTKTIVASFGDTSGKERSAARYQEMKRSLP
ncbi:MAG: M48 family metalloprotease [Candidatus Krumholzibacteriota bacterium]|nr:M48 family metalloprotease [Candidatus Krumholzibacteriota bacterium]